MGNCIIHESQDQWGGEDWSPALDRSYNNHKNNDNGDELESCSQKPAFRTEVKLKITKKQLQELIGKTELQGLSIQEALKKMSSEHKIQPITSWRPRLQSIPEANSFNSRC